MGEYNWQDMETDWLRSDCLHAAWNAYKPPRSKPRPCDWCGGPVTFTEVSPTQTRATCPCGQGNKERCEDWDEPRTTTPAKPGDGPKGPG